MDSRLEDLVIQSHKGPYRVRFGSPFEGLESGLGAREHLLVDARVAELYAGPLAAALKGPSVLRIEATEENKSLERFPAYIGHLLKHGIRRDHTLVAVGGGVLQDIAAFLAAILHRGIAWRFHPTTLLAQADSCIGSKSSVNVAGYKNQLGTFTPPKEIRISTDLLETLSEVDLRSGIGEMIKVHLISGREDTQGIAADYPRLLTDRPVLLRRIRRSLEIKRELIERDEFDRDERLVMNYGHSFGHAIESATRFQVPHGIAVTIGMDLANYLSWAWGFLGRELFEEIHPLLAANIRGFEEVEIPEEHLFLALGRDKKNLGGDLSLILTRGPGRMFRGRVPQDENLRRICRDYFKEAGCQSLLR
ncbi:MAG: 3-dehydroquinate synthase [Candidatus Omnitrophica bacterium]|nr:3-dehydroquinate synthase [Candidatus Omnitrophota bacterium]